VLVTCNCKLQKKLGEQDVLVAPPIILLGGTTALPVPAPMKQAPNATFLGNFLFRGSKEPIGDEAPATVRQ